MPQFQVHNLWPQPLVVHKGVSITEKQADYVRAVEYYRPPADNGWLSNNTYLLDNPVMKTLKDQIMDAFNKSIVDHILSLPDEMKFRMTNSWSVKHEHGEFAQQHIHTNSIWSGVYYLDVDEVSGKISFHRPINDERVLPMSMRPGRHKEQTPYNEYQYSHIPEKGDLIFFPSSLEHSVAKNQSKGERHSIAFNFFATGNWGEMEHELVL